MYNGFRKAPVVETLFFREYRYVAILEVDVFPVESLSTFVTLIAENFCSPNTRIREEVDESAVATGFDSSLSVLTDVVDGFACLFVNECSELSAVIS